LYTLDLPIPKEGAQEKQIGWRFTGQIAACDISIDVEDAGGNSVNPQMIALGSGDLIPDVRNRLRAISNRPETDTYDLRLLSIPALGVEAIWLVPKNPKNEGPEEDFVYPCRAPAAFGLRPKPMKFGDFVAALRDVQEQNANKEEKRVKPK